MKKLTFLLLLVTSFLFAQQPQSYVEVDTGSIEVNTTNNQTEATVTGITNNRDLIDIYTTQSDFDAAFATNCTGALTSEDFTGGPGGIQGCGPVISSAGDGCFAAGELEAGFDTQASNGTDVVYIPAGAIGNVDPLVGAITFAEFTVINFSPDVFAVTMDVWENNDPNTDIRIFGAGGVLIEAFTVITPVNSQTFFGVIADEAITRIELEGQNDSGELYGQFSYGGDCMALSVGDNLAELVDIFPNPANDILQVRVPASINVNSVALFDVLGKNTGAVLVNGQINVSQLARGVYILNVNTDSGTLTQKIVKQ